ncbi:MAG: hypothetical protein HYY46_23275 [Deltaproteobacteria bacterium]|nr:hypothetical protein [Deltaproteobacteria bacterium]
MMQWEGHSIRKGSVLAALLVFSLITGVSSAQDTRLAEARKEGKVVWYTGAALFTAENVAKRFEQAYPGIKVEVHRSGSERILQRLMQEAAAGIKNADVSYPQDKPKLSDLKLLMVDSEELERRSEEIKKRFVEFFGA